MEVIDIVLGGEKTKVSKRCLIYLMQFIESNVFKNSISKRSNSNFLFGITFILPAPYGPQHLHVYKPRKIGAGKLIVALVPLQQIIEADNKQTRLIQLLFQVFKIFLIDNYKFTPEFMDDLWGKIDLQYLVNIPYPPLEDDIAAYHIELSKQ